MQKMAKEETTSTSSGNNDHLILDMHSFIFLSRSIDVITRASAEAISPPIRTYNKL